jgi:hypothetical protein
MSNSRELLELAARFRVFARQTSLDSYATRMLRAAKELEIEVEKQHRMRVAKRLKRAPPTPR